MQDKRTNTYKYIGEWCGMTKQNAHYIITGRTLGSYESYKQLDRFFANTFTFEMYMQQIIEVLESSDLKEVSDVTGLTWAELNNIKRKNNKPNWSSLEKLENYIELIKVFDKINSLCYY